ncbi:hypothetical protein K432DRAFT_387757 [Lepidopterella palustris CBS 459.81]|uniref:Alpha/beta hydrolase fold-3 domain-containing protein n=1 Tax=Lepidopterella palustris CBS 459.81 TaxID=1314670 RepID=A0A8E2EMA7_9PEZI|nr:hypothetical protein K432DRAFT_387757 [Lepidopterella palustris CBS 459.81]
MASHPKPPYDAELAAALAQMPIPKEITKEMIPLIRAGADQTTAEIAIAGKQISHEERSIPGPGGDILLSIFRPTTDTGSTSKPGIYFIHGGGMIMGNRFLGMNSVADWIEACDAVAVSVEYRQAPENPHPAPIEDCYAGLEWVGEHLTELGIDPARLMLSGQSAGGCLAASLALMVRDKGGPALCALCLICPMLDDRNVTLSSKQFDGEGTWSRGSNLLGWSCLLGDKAGGESVPEYAVPGRTEDLSRLPPVFVDVGSAEVFRDEDVAFASRIWACGGQAELHVWPGRVVEGVERDKNSVGEEDVEGALLLRNALVH